MAVDLTWTGTANKFFDVAGNWMPAKPPAKNNDTIAVANAVVESNATIEVNALGTIKGVTLNITGKSTFTIANGAALANNGDITVGDGSTLALSGTETNGGTITLNGDKATTSLTLNAATTLTGKGKVVLSDSTMNQIDKVGAGKLINMDNSISGAGTITAPLVNMATVTADGKNALVLAAAVTNSGMLAATGAGGLTIKGAVVENAIRSKVGNKTTVTPGTIAATGGNVTLDSSKVTGGTLTAAANMNILVNGSVTLDGSTNLGSVTINTTGLFSSLKVASGARLRLKGLIEDTGAIALTGPDTVLSISGAVTLQGAGGDVILVGPSRIEGEAKSNATLSNSVSIFGVGQIGDGKKTLTLTNTAAGSITAIDGKLDINTGSTVVNEGNIGSGGAVGNKYDLVLHDSVANANGTITAHGGSVVLATAGLTITGGTLKSELGGEFLLKANATFSGIGGTLTNNADINVANSTLTIQGVVNSTGDVVTNVDGTGSIVIAGKTAGKNPTPAARFYGVGSIDVPILDDGLLEAQAQGDNATLKLNGALTGSGALKIDSDSTLQLTAAATSAAKPFTSAVEFAGSNAKLAVEAPLKLQTPITGFATTDTIDLLSTPFATAKITLGYAVGADKGTLTVKDNGNVVATLVFKGAGFKDFKFTDMADETPAFEGATEILLKQAPAECFVSGTHIATPAGPVPVERLAAGDRVVTADGTTHAVTWAGRRTVEPLLLRDPLPMLPVRIARDALAPGLPHRDLLVSPDHGLLIDGWLVQARLLLNGASIRQEVRARVTYHHVELARHDILLAEGVAAESYLDTGNRAAFAPGPQFRAPEFAGDPAARARLSCAPLAVAPAVTAPIWQRLADRAAALGYALPDAATTTDPGLQLVVDGAARPMLRQAADRYVAVPPPGARRARLRSRCAAPAATRPWLDDRRQLGVAVARIRLHGPDGIDELAVDHPHLGHPGPQSGWHTPERDGVRLWRWTDGDAGLPLPGNTWLVELRLAGEQRYPVGGSPYTPAWPQPGSGRSYA